MVEKVVSKVPMRIDNAYASPGLDVLENQIAEQGRLARSAFADSVEMVSPVGMGKREGQFLPPMFA
jgi:hypothetical protein